jgi:hypothetical protein
MTYVGGWLDEASLSCPNFLNASPEHKVFLSCLVLMLNLTSRVVRQVSKDGMVGVVTPLPHNRLCNKIVGGRQTRGRRSVFLKAGVAVGGRQRRGRRSAVIKGRGGGRRSGAVVGVPQGGGGIRRSSKGGGGSRRSSKVGAAVGVRQRRGRGRRSSKAGAAVGVRQRRGRQGDVRQGTYSDVRQGTCTKAG